MVFNHSLLLIRKRRRASGLTLVEFLVAMPIGLLAIAAAVMLWAYASRTTAAFFNYTDMSISSKNALDRISMEIRNAIAVKSCATNQLVIVDPDGVEIDYSYTSNRLTQTKGGTQTTLLTGCNFFEFKIFQRTPQSGTDALFETSNTNTAKVVQMKWTCARQLSGDTTNVQSQVSSKVVIRSKRQI